MAIEPLHSTLRDDPDMAELIDFFLDELHERIDALSTAWQQADKEALKYIAHGLKGAAGGYGYQDITERAADLEREIAIPEADLAQLTERVEALLELCRRATSARSNHPGSA